MTYYITQAAKYASAVKGHVQQGAHITSHDRTGKKRSIGNGLKGIICLHAEHDFCLRAQAGYTVSVCKTIGMWYAANQKS